jgi:DNA-binding SARP family transcriptional activator
MRPEVLVLGAVGVRCEGRLHQPSSGLARAVLALLAEAGDAGVSEGRLVDTVWGESACGSVHTVAVHRLRRWLQAVVGDAVRVERTAAGYRLGPAGLGTDVAAFRLLAAGAGALDPAARADRLDAALALWRGPAFADVAPERTDPAVLAGLAREHRDATLAHGAALLETGDAAGAVGLLQAAAARQPLDEALHAAWIEALRAAGRRAEAITAFHAIRARLREEFGVDPGRELNTAMARVLRAEPAPAVPAQLPPASDGFLGRHREQAALDELLGAHRAVVVVGMGGVGKTDLVLHWAAAAAARFPDGQLHADLRGYAAGEPVAPVAVLHRFLRALGLPDEQLPADVDEAASRYRSLLRGRRVLVVLDDAASADQVRPLLPGTPGCRVVVTGRGGLDGLVAVNGAARLGVEPLDEATAVALLRWSLGAQRSAAETRALRALAAACGYLPLALRVAALRLTVSATCSIAAYTARLRRGGLAELAVDGDPRSDLSAVFGESYRRLPAPTRRLFRLLGDVPGPDITAERTATLAGMAPAAARREMDRLVAVHLLSSPTAGHYTLHGLVREHARSLAWPATATANRATAPTRTPPRRSPPSPAVTTVRAPRSP